MAKFELNWGGQSVPELEEYGQEFWKQLGTIGAGNHFCELQTFEEIIDPDLFEEAKLDFKKAYLLVHSGSRGYGKHVLDQFVEEHQSKGIKGFQPGTPEYKEYLQKHDDACNYARRNRALIAVRFLQELFGDREPELDSEYISLEEFSLQKDLKLLEDLDCVVDIWHNYMEVGEKEVPTKVDIAKIQEANYDTELQKKQTVIHRKGATPSDKGFVVIPGSRGSYSYLVKPLDENQWVSGYSLAHGAGRKMNRSKALQKGKHTYKNTESLTTTSLDSVVV